MQPRRPNEQEVIDSLLLQFDQEFSSNIKVDLEVEDCPDLVFENDGKRIGVELTWLGYEKFMKWLSKGTEAETRREAQIFVNLEKQLLKPVKDKNKKYRKYRSSRNLDEVWLVLHNDIYEFSESNVQLNSRWFKLQSAFYLKLYGCKFDRVYFFAENSKQCLELKRKGEAITPTSPSTKIPIMKLITVTTIATGQDITFTDENFPLSDDETFDGPT